MAPNSHLNPHSFPSHNQPLGRSAIPIAPLPIRNATPANARSVITPNEAIEAAFVDWNKAGWIERHYGLTGETTLYRHARATGLDVRRRENLRTVVEKVLEDVNFIETPTASALLRAVRTCACLNDRGQWVEPPTTHVAISATQPPAQSANPPATTSRKPARRPSLKMLSNRQTYEKLEVAATPSKQKQEVTSNR
ncbi:MAG TPA: hypothetical protein VKB26_04545 [Candidatus Acidoferrales bacterium]|nr:hypothetical protein [Candidatus Acidoferrales bacterium]